MSADGPRPDGSRFSLATADLDGHTIEELSAYLDADRQPRDPTIEASPACQLALQAMERLRAASGRLLTADAETESAADESWVRQVLAGIALDARAGRRIPLRHVSPGADLGITEGAVRGVIRSAEDDVDGVVVGRCRIDGDLEAPNGTVDIAVDVSVRLGVDIPSVAGRLRAAIAARVQANTDLSVRAIDITVHDVHFAPQQEDAP
ncbi:MAG TPA: Asp23/Gls24 family envelope stress response protein [Cellulomonas sp.]